jgi:hypothetical protein
LSAKTASPRPTSARHDGEVGHEAGRQQQRLGETREGSQLQLEGLMRQEMSADEVRSARADTPGPRAGAGGFNQRWIAGQTEIVVAAKADQLAAVDACQRAA